MRTIFTFTAAVLLLAGCQNNQETAEDPQQVRTQNDDTLSVRVFETSFSVQLKADANEKTKIVASPWIDKTEDPLLIKPCTDCEQVNLISLADEAMNDFLEKYKEQLNNDFQAHKGKEVEPVLQTINIKISGEVGEDPAIINSAQAMINSDWTYFTGETENMVLEKTYSDFELIEYGEDHKLIEENGTAISTEGYSVMGGNCECTFPTCYINCSTCPMSVDMLGNCWKNVCRFSLYLECWCVNRRKVPCPPGVTI